MGPREIKSNSELKMKRFDPDIFMSSVYHEAGEKEAWNITWREACRLLSLKGEPFIFQAYTALLGRDPDPTGLEAYASRSRTLAGRFMILTALYFSTERLWLPYWQRKFIRIGGSLIRKIKRS